MLTNTEHILRFIRLRPLYRKNIFKLEFILTFGRAAGSKHRQTHLHTDRIKRKRKTSHAWGSKLAPDDSVPQSSGKPYDSLSPVNKSQVLEEHRPSMFRAQANQWSLVPNLLIQHLAHHVNTCIGYTLILKSDRHQLSEQIHLYPFPLNSDCECS